MGGLLDCQGVHISVLKFKKHENDSRIQTPYGEGNTAPSPLTLLCMPLALARSHALPCHVKSFGLPVKSVYTQKTRTVSLNLLQDNTSEQ